MLIIENNKSLKKYNSFHIDSIAKYFVTIENEQDLVPLQNNDSLVKSKKFILGGGANILFVDDFDGMILHSQINDLSIIEETSDYAIVQAGSGCKWDDLVEFALSNNLYGIENLISIPGSVGAAPVQNIGAYGVEQQDSFYSLDAFDLDTFKKTTFSKADCKFGYRDSFFKAPENNNKYFITQVRYKLSKREQLNCDYKDVKEAISKKGIKNLNAKILSQVISEIRNSKLPNLNEIGCAGSFFKNPFVSAEKAEELKSIYNDIPIYKNGDSYKTSAAYLIEKCGLKAYREGDAGVYDRHSLILINYGKASGRELFNLSKKVQNIVMEKIGIALECEAIIVESDKK